jgi:magnesium chelatase family protein
MYAKIISATLKGIEGIPVRVETDLSAGLPAFLLTGLPSTSIREAGERIHRAIANSGYSFPEKKITVNLSPANQRKEGTQFDLPIALGILAADGKIPAAMLKGCAFLGELSLDGKIYPIRGALALAAGLRKKGIRRIYLPEGNAEEVSLLEDIAVYPVRSLAELAEDLKNGVVPEGARLETAPVEADAALSDFADVRGQEAAKRAFEVAAAGNHAILLSGTPGSGKTMMVRCLPGILPPMTPDERLEVTMLYSVAGELKGTGGYVRARPFREPHHTVPITALIGGGVSPRPGEISLAHKGVLFLDEFPEYDRHVLEALREPLESKRIVLTRLTDTVAYPSDFLLAAACNPCPCGYFGDPEIACTCSPGEIRRYRARLSGPIMDRIDLRIHVGRVKYADLSASGDAGPRSSEEMRKSVLRAVEIQNARYAGRRTKRNAELTAREIKQFCRPTAEGEALLENAFSRLRLSARAYGKILKVARTVADLENVDAIDARHIAEAIRYRTE